MARPERMRKSQVLGETAPRVCWEPTRKTIPQAKRATTTVRRAVARWELTSLTPILASTAVRPANPAEAKAQASHIAVSPFPQIILYLGAVCPEKGDGPMETGEIERSVKQGAAA